MLNVSGLHIWIDWHHVVIYKQRARFSSHPRVETAVFEHGISSDSLSVCSVFADFSALTCCTLSSRCENAAHILPVSSLLYPAACRSVLKGDIKKKVNWPSFPNQYGFYIAQLVVGCLMLPYKNQQHSTEMNTNCSVAPNKKTNQPPRERNGEGEKNS